MNAASWNFVQTCICDTLSSMSDPPMHKGLPDALSDGAFDPIQTRWCHLTGHHPFSDSRPLAFLKSRKEEKKKGITFSRDFVCVIEYQVLLLQQRLFGLKETQIMVLATSKSELALVLQSLQEANKH